MKATPDSPGGMLAAIVLGALAVITLLLLAVDLRHALALSRMIRHDRAELDALAGLSGNVDQGPVRLEGRVQGTGTGAVALRVRLRFRPESEAPRGLGHVVGWLEQERVVEGEDLHRS